MKRPSIYMDYAAATPMSEQAIAAMEPYLSSRFYNPSAIYLSAKNVAYDIASARKRIAHHLGARTTEIIFTAGGTEANNLAIRGVMELNRKTKILTSTIEHESVIRPAAIYSQVKLGVNSNGIIKINELSSLIDDDTIMVSIMYANNEIGTIQPIKQIANIIKDIRQNRQEKGNNLPLYLHVDACQATAYLDIHVSRLGVDLMTINSGKIYGPKQVGALYVRTGTKLLPLIYGGGQERNLRSGTENVAGIMGFSAALDEAITVIPSEYQRLTKLRDIFINNLLSRIPKILINGTLKNRLPNNVNVTLLGRDSERLLMELDEAGIQAASGSACSASNKSPSHVLKAIGLSDNDASSTLRFTLGKYSTMDEVKYVVDTLAKLLV